MNKTETLAYLRAAKKAHIKWRSYAQALHMGLPLDNSATPIISTECDFGEWYYEGGQELNYLESYRAIEKPHQDIHDIYMKMYQEKNRTIKVGLFGSKDKAEKERAANLEILMQQMLTVSTDLLEKIAVLEEEICHMDENCEIEEYQKKKETLNNDIVVDAVEVEKPVEKEIKKEVKRVIKADGSSLTSELSDLLN